MMKSKASYDNGDKFLFSENIFDEGYTEEPPPPMFSEQELGHAKQQQFSEGKRAGLKEAEDSQLKLTAQILDKIQKELVALTAAESLREKIYEQESIRLCLAVFQKLFPLYSEQAGFEELKAALAGILKKQEAQNHIMIYVQPDIVTAIETHLNDLKEKGHDIQFSVKGDEALPLGGCRLAWSDGGAVRDPEMIADEIRASLQQVLAKKGLKGHDGGQGEPA